MSVNRELIIGNRKISDDTGCFVIAEIGHNHQGDVETCMALIKSAAECGVDAVKLQKRNNRQLYTRKFFNSPYNSVHAYANTYGLHRQSLEFNKRHYLKLKKYAEKLGLIFFATPFDFNSVDFLEQINVPCYKIASADLRNTPLLEYIAIKKKPMIISTGAADMKDVKRAFKTVWPINKKISILQCTASYPVDPSLMNLKVIETYRKKFPAVVGLSDHYSGIALDVAAYLLGARIIEKHFTLNRSMKGSDHAFSLEPQGMRKMVRDLKRTALALGNGNKRFYNEEREALRKMGKSIVAAKTLVAGYKLKKSDISFKTPFDGLHPYEANKVLGKRLKVNLRKDQVILASHF